MHVRIEGSVGGAVAPEKVVAPPRRPGAASVSCLYPLIHVMSTLTLGAATLPYCVETQMVLQKQSCLFVGFSEGV